MGGAWKIGRFLGIGVYFHWTLLALLAFIGYTAAAGEGTLVDAAWAILLVVSVFGCVLLHEYGHALAARQLGIKTLDITLLPIGGIARLERMPRRPLHEFLVAIAGPAVNVVIAAILLPIVFVWGSLQEASLEAFVGGSMLVHLLAINIMLVVFNMIPAFPMDGGRIFRSLLASQLSYLRATKIAVNVGRVVAVGMGIYGLSSPPYMLCLIGVFVFFAGRAELRGIEIDSRLCGALVRQALERCSRVLAPWNTVHDAAAAMAFSQQRDFPVIEPGSPMGIVEYPRLCTALAEERFSQPVAEIMRRGVPVLQESDPLQKAYDLLIQTGASALPVVSGNTVIGLVTLNGIRHYSLPAASLGRSEIIQATVVTAKPTSTPQENTTQASSLPRGN